MRPFGPVCRPLFDLGGLLGGQSSPQLPALPPPPKPIEDPARDDEIARRRRLAEELRRGRESLRIDPSTNAGGDPGVNLPSV